MEREKEENRSCMDGTVMHLARLGALPGCVVTTMVTESRMRQEKADDGLNIVWEVPALCTGEYREDGVGSDEGCACCRVR